MNAPKFNLPQTENKMSFKNIVGKKMTKVEKFMGEEIKISKLSVSQILDIQNAAKAAEVDETKGFEILKTIVRASAEGAAEISDEDFSNLPMDELSKLSNSIMVFSGIDSGKSK